MASECMDFIAENEEYPYIIKGPMGRGLDLQKSGIHIAFTAGTGVLPFLDLVAYMIRLNLGLLKEKAIVTEENGPQESRRQMVNEVQQQIDFSNFKFLLFTSYRTAREAFGRELCKGLGYITESKGLKNFEYIERLSVSSLKKTAPNLKGQEDKATTHGIEADRHWDENFIKQVLSKYSSQTPLSNNFGLSENLLASRQGISKVWVCGPPNMSNTFETALRKLSSIFKLNPLTDIQIM